MSTLSSHYFQSNFLSWNFVTAARIFFLFWEFSTVVRIFYCFKIFFLVVRIFSLLWEFFHYNVNLLPVTRDFFCLFAYFENFLFAVRIFLLLWEFFCPKHKFLVNHAMCPATNVVIKMSIGSLEYKNSLEKKLYNLEYSLEYC